MNIINFFLNVNLEVDINHDKNVKCFLAFMSYKYIYMVEVKIQPLLIKISGNIQNGQVCIAIDVSNNIRLQKKWVGVNNYQVVKSSDNINSLVFSPIQFKSLLYKNWKTEKSRKLKKV